MQGIRILLRHGSVGRGANNATVRLVHPYKLAFIFLTTTKVVVVHMKLNPRLHS